jgi:protein TonB
MHTQTLEAPQRQWAAVRPPLPAGRLRALAPWALAVAGHGLLLGAMFTSPHPTPASSATPLAIQWVTTPSAAPATPTTVPPTRQTPPRPAPARAAASAPPAPSAEPTPLAPRETVPASPRSEAASAPPTAQATPAAQPAATPAAPAAPVIAARFDADYLHNPPPAYPPISRRLGEEGRVVLRAHVLPDGRADNVEIRQSSGSPRLDAAALDTVRRWRFVPARQGSEAIASWVLVPIAFRLEN